MMNKMRNLGASVPTGKSGGGSSSSSSSSSSSAETPKSTPSTTKNIQIYEAPDGFRGTYREVVEHEKKLGLGGKSEPKPEKDEGTGSGASDE